MKALLLEQYAVKDALITTTPSGRVLNLVCVTPDSVVQLTLPIDAEAAARFMRGLRAPGDVVKLSMEPVRVQEKEAPEPGREREP